MNWQSQIEVITGEVPKHFLRIAYLIGEKESQDPVTHTGAIIVAQDLATIVGYGANHFPKGFVIPEGLEDDRDLRLKAVIHAEPAAIYDAAKHGGGTNNAVMYMPWVPCTGCAKAVVDSGITMLVAHKQLLLMTDEKVWTDPKYEMDFAFKILSDAGVRHCMYDGEIGSVRHLYKGKVWEP